MFSKLRENNLYSNHIKLYLQNALIAALNILKINSFLTNQFQQANWLISHILNIYYQNILVYRTKLKFYR